MRTILMAGLTAWLGMAPAWATPVSETFTSTVFFGDSLSDTGNLGGFAPPPPYFNGQFSNGPVWADIVDDSFAPTATRNYAFGGAETDSPAPPGLDTQISLMGADVIGLSGNPLTLGARPLASIWMGANNLFDALEDFGLGLIIDDPAAEAAADQVATDAAADIGAGLQRLVDDFAIRDFLIFTLPDLGRTPRIAQLPPLVPDARDLTETFNAALIAEMGGLTGPSIEVTTIDVFGIFDAIAGGTVLPGVTNIGDPCFDGATVCADPDTYLFWDEVHPTAVAHSELARIVEAQFAPIPVPPALPLMAAGLLALGWVSRRRAI